MVFSATFKRTFKSFAHGWRNPFFTSTTDRPSPGRGKRMMSAESPKVRTRGPVDCGGGGGGGGGCRWMVVIVIVVVKRGFRLVVQVD